MAIFRINKTSDYTVLSNRHLKEKEMSLKAKGLLTVMLSMPDGWDYSIGGLVSICKENESAIKTALDELKCFGYLTVTKKMPSETTSGRIEYEYNIFEQPQKQEGEKQGVENQGLVFQGVENRTQSNTNKLSIKELNTYNKTPVAPNGGASKAEECFEQFWSAYPRKVNKQGAKKAFLRIPNLLSQFTQIMAGLENQKRSKQWKKDNGVFIPHPTTWIHQERWKEYAETKKDDILDKIF